MINNRTANLSLPLPDAGNNLSEDVARLIESLSIIDVAMASKAEALDIPAAYSHPANHPPSVIMQDASNRFVTDAEKASWSAKQAALVSGASIKTINGQSLLGGGNLALASSSLSGSTTIYIGQEISYTITDHDVFSTYTASATPGSATVSGSIVTFTAPSAAGSATLTLTTNGVDRTIALTVLPAGISAPAITAPTSGATGVLYPPTITASAFVAFGIADTHLNTDYELWTGANRTGVMVASSYANSSSKTSWATPSGITGSNTAYYPAVRYRGAILGASAWATSSFTTVNAAVATPAITSPANAATGITETPTITTSAFAAIGIADTHLNSDWELWTGASRTGTKVASLYASTSSKVSWTVSAGILAVNTAYYPAVLHRGATLGASGWASSSFTTAATFNVFIATPAATPAAFGDALEGGFYAGLIWNELIQSATSTVIATGSKVFTVADMTAVPIVYLGQALEVRSRANPTNKMTGTVTSAIGTTLTVNVASVTGSGTFADWSIMAQYRVIVAPKATGENSAIAYKNANDAAPAACGTLSEGRKATLAMVAAGTSTVYPAAHWCNNLSIAGKTDWYVPARDELELCWRNLKPTADANHVTADRPTGQTPNYMNLGSYGDTANTHGLSPNTSPAGAAHTSGVPAQVAAGKNFRTGESEAFIYGSSYYWSSTEYNATSAWFQFWYSSVPGSQNNNGKTYTFCVRACRRSVI